MNNKSKYYTCNFCYEQYIPTRRGAQKYCSDSCRVKSHHHRKKQQQQKVIGEYSKKLNYSISDYNQIPKKNEIEKMSIAGVANATVGNLAAEGLKTLLTKNDNKPATKKDIIDAVIKIKNRYHLVKNMTQLTNGKKPFFDLETNTIIYM